MMLYTKKYISPIGEIIIASNGKEITGLWFVGQKYFEDNLSSNHIEKDISIFGQVTKWLDIYFSGSNPSFTPPLAMENISPFRKRIWQIMLEIPYGQYTTYGKIAKQLELETGKKVSPQAVGGAIKQNSISIIIPCHRVIGSNGKLIGYSGGLDKKLELLKLEKIIK
mgnify:CR=1 FL=1